MKRIPAIVLCPLSSVLALTATAAGALRLSEICPKPQMACKTDSSKQTDAEDPNGVVAGWIELVNEGPEAVNLKDYKLGAFNRGKEVKAKKFASLPDRIVASGERIVIYTTKDYCEGGRFSSELVAEDTVKAFVAGETKGIVKDEIVWATKINPKKFPLVQLVQDKTVIDTVIVPAEMPDDASVVLGSSDDAKGATCRYLSTKPTPGKANDVSGAVKLGPNVGPLYGVAHEFSDLDPVAPATSGRDYPVTLDVNPVFGGTEKDAIASVRLLYRTDVNATATTAIDMAKSAEPVDGHGDRWTATVPSGKLPAKGMLLQWKAEITDKAGNVWTSPAFNNKDAGYEWYGTIVDPGVGDGDGQNSATLPTLHLFAIEGNSSYPMTDRPGKSNTRGDGCMMNLDYDEVFEDPTTKDTSKMKSYRSYYPYGGRVAIYDAQTSNYYDNVRIDCRGNSSDDYYKRSHGLKFSKIKPYRLAKTYKHPVSGEKIDEVAKTSLHGEFNDPAGFRQRASFWFMNEVGVPAPWEDPKRVNLNGKFYQFAYETPRFGDELLCDFYGLDEQGYGYKNVGSLHLWNNCHYGQSGTSADAGTKKKTPDDGNERDHAELLAFHDEIGGVSTIKDSASNPNDTTGLDNATVTKKVVEKFDLPAWINYLAATKITQEGDDAWGNLSAYYDNVELLDGGVRGAGTWRPIAWDMNCAWGQFYTVHVNNIRNGLHANQDWNKCHPLYGGRRILGYKSSSASTSNSNYGYKGANYGFEAVFQSTKFRRLFLRRLRTLMDAYLKAPKTAEADTPIAVKMQEFAAEIQAESVKDRGVWGHLGTDGGNKDCAWVNCWGTKLMSAGGNQPDNPSYGYTDIWQNYIVPRRVHLYETHSVDNTKKTVGYGLNLNAGIPHGQSAFGTLRDQIMIRYDATLGAAVIENMNAETVDISGWKVSGPVEMTLPPGTVLDQANGKTPGQVFVTADRRETIKEMTLTDQVVVGNGTAGASTVARLANAAGDPVYPLKAIVEVTTSGKGTGSVTGAGEYESGAMVTLVAMPEMGSHFTEWTFADETTSTENPLEIKDVQGSVAVDAKFKVNSYSVKYDPNGGEGEIEPGEGDYGSKYETAECTFTKAGKVCTGWGTNGVEGLVFVCRPGEEVTNLATEDGAKVTLYAMWEAKFPVPDDPAELTTNVTLSVGETLVVTNRFRKNLRFWLLGSSGGGECAVAELNLPTNACDLYRGYTALSSVKTNEVILTITGKAIGEESISLGRKYKFKDPVHAVRYNITVR